MPSSTDYTARQNKERKLKERITIEVMEKYRKETREKFDDGEETTVVIDSSVPPPKPQWSSERYERHEVDDCGKDTEPQHTVVVEQTYEKPEGEPTMELLCREREVVAMKYRPVDPETRESVPKNPEPKEESVVDFPVCEYRPPRGSSIRSRSSHVSQHTISIRNSMRSQHSSTHSTRKSSGNTPEKLVDQPVCQPVHRDSTCKSTENKPEKPVDQPVCKPVHRDSTCKSIENQQEKLVHQSTCPPVHRDSTGKSTGSPPNVPVGQPVCPSVHRESNVDCPPPPSSEPRHSLNPDVYCEKTSERKKSSCHGEVVATRTSSPSTFRSVCRETKPSQPTPRQSLKPEYVVCDNAPRSPASSPSTVRSVKRQESLIYCEKKRDSSSHNSRPSDVASDRTYVMVPVECEKPRKSQPIVVPIRVETPRRDKNVSRESSFHSRYRVQQRHEDRAASRATSQKCHSPTFLSARSTPTPVYTLKKVQPERHRYDSSPSRSCRYVLCETPRERDDESLAGRPQRVRQETVTKETFERVTTTKKLFPATYI